MLRTLPVIIVSIWLGCMGFMAFVVAPTAFDTLEREPAGLLVGALFPRYYWVGLGLGLLALAAYLGGWRRRRPGLARWVVLFVLLVMLAGTGYAMAVLLPEARSARAAMRHAEAGADAAAREALRFARVHRLSGLVNGVVLVAGLALVAVEMARKEGEGG